MWADRLALGWLIRFFTAPRGFSAKVQGCGALAPMIWKYGSQASKAVARRKPGPDVRTRQPIVELAPVSVFDGILTMILGLTGGFGCGKSTAAKLFAERGFRHIDSDIIVRERVLPPEPVTAAPSAPATASGVFLPTGQVDRPALGEDRVFG